MNISLKGKRALIGGSSRGLGLAVAKQLAYSGASVTLMSRNENKLKDIVYSLEKETNNNHSYLVVDFNNFNFVISMMGPQYMPLLFMMLI